MLWEQSVNGEPMTLYEKTTELYNVAKLLEGDKKTCITRSVEQRYARVKYLDKE